MSDSDPRRPLREDPAAPHTMPAPRHVPRWIAWLVLAAFAVCSTLCVRMVVGG
jgi:hypothetical protein